MDPTSALLLAPVLLMSVVAHEYAHGYAALKQGDETALVAGRLTLNPIKHIDPFMTILLPAILWWSTNGAAVFGGAKPVPVNPRNYRRLVRGDIIVSLAGVFTNLLIAIASAILFALIGGIGKAIGGSTALGVLQAMAAIGVWLNLSLIAFNLIPIPPLDGSHVFKYLLPTSLRARYAQVGFGGLIAIFLLMKLFPRALDVWMAPVSFGSRVIFGLVGPLTLPEAQQWLVR